MLKLKSLIFISLTLLLTSGCSNKQTLDVDSTPKMQVPKKIEPPKTKKGSLYSRRGASLFADKKDLQIGDIILVKVQEDVSSKSQNKKETTRENSSSIGTNPFQIPTGASSGTTNRINRLNSAVGIGLNVDNSTEFTGEAKSSATEDFETTISAIIEQTYQNGNYFVKGSKEILINGQKQIVKVSGVIRPYDITPENSVSSNQMANLKVFYEKKGDEMDALEKPWLGKVIDTISPF